MIKILKHYKIVTQDTIHINDLGQDPMKDMNEFFTTNRRKHNTTPIIPKDEVWHYDIAYGVGTAIGDIRYVLLITGRHNRYTYEFSLKSLEYESLLTAMQMFVGLSGHKFKCMIADRNFKLL